MMARLALSLGVQLVTLSDSDYEPAVTEGAIDLETPNPPNDLEMFEVQFLETENSSSNRTGSGSGVGIHSITRCAPTMAASTSTVINLELGIDVDAEEKTALGPVTALISYCSSSHLAMVLLAMFANLAGDWETTPRMFTRSDKDEAHWVNATCIHALLSGNDGGLKLLLSTCGLLGASWYLYLSV